MRWMKGIGFLLVSISLIAGCGKDEKTNQEIQEIIKEKAQKERQLYQGMQKDVENIEKSLQQPRKESEK